MSYLHRKLKLAAHEHSGRLRPHEYTSYLPLMVLMLVVGLALTVCSVSALDPGPQAGSVSLTGTMPGPPPTTAATITSPNQSQHFSTSPVTISGTCPKDTLVEIYKNDIFAGSGPCSSSGTFSFQIDLLIGQNALVARVYNALNEPGPDSNKVTTYYDALPPQGSSIIPLNFSGTQLLLNTNSVYRGLFPGTQFSVPISIIGGTPPYAVNIQWGDSKNDVVSRNDNTSFNATHTYSKPGTFQITIQATDAHGLTAFLTVAAIVNGQPGAVTASSKSEGQANKLLVLWPLYAISATMLVSFWLGERREKQVMLAHHPVVITPHAQR